MHTFEFPLMLTVKETADLLRIQRAKVYILIESGVLSAVKIGSSWRVRRDSVEALIGPLAARVTSVTPLKDAAQEAHQYSGDEQ
jgi:excisionase family DNA binding protein